MAGPLKNPAINLKPTYRDLVKLCYIILRYSTVLPAPVREEEQPVPAIAAAISV
jgi:hypothetical protein